MTGASSWRIFLREKLHAFGDGDSEEIESGAEDAIGDGAEGESGGAWDGIGFEDGASFEETVEEAREFVEVIAEEIGAIIVEDLGEDFTELEEFEGEGEFGGVIEGEGERGGGVLEVGFAENALDADAAVLEVGGGIAGEGEHFVPRESVIALAIGEEIGVFDGADADDLGDGAAFGFWESGIFFGDDGEGAFFGFVEEVGEFDGLAAAGFEGSAIGAEDGAEPDVGEFGLGGGLPAAEDGEELVEVVLLSSVGDVEDGIWGVRLETVVESGEIGGGVIGGAVGFLDEGRELDPLAVALDEKGVFFFGEGAIGEDAEGAFAGAGDAEGAEGIDGGGENGVVEAFAEGGIESDLEALIDDGELILGEAEHFLPEGEIFGVPGLEMDEFGAGGGEGGGVFLATSGDEFVEAFHFAEGIDGELVWLEFGFPADEEHPELGSPVSDVVIADDAVADERGDAGEGVAEDGGADVTDVHRFGDIGGAEVNDDGFLGGRGGDTEVGIGGEGGESGGEGGGAESKIDEAGAGDFWGFGEIIDLEIGDDFGGELAGVGALILGEDHGDIGLVVTEAEVCGGLNAGLLGGESGESGVESGFELGGESHQLEVVRRAESSLKMARISSAEEATARLSRVLGWLRNLAIEARVRRWVWNWSLGTTKRTTNLTGWLSRDSNSRPSRDRPKAATTFWMRSEEAWGMAMPKPMPVLMVSSRWRMALRMDSRSSGANCFWATRRSTSSSMAPQRSLATIAGRMSGIEKRLLSDIRENIRETRSCG